jgi:hypothetical protein
MPKAEISWKREDENGETLQVYAHHVGDRWIFYKRRERYDMWMEQEEPPLEDWMELLDGVRRRISRRLVRPEEEANVKRLIRRQFPEAKFDE